MKWTGNPPIERRRAKPLETRDRLDRVRGALTGLSLSERELGDDSFVARISELRARANELMLTLDGDEGWLVQWLDREQVKGSILYAAAMINKQRNGLVDSSPADPRSRSKIVGRFNDWAIGALARLEAYEASSREPHVVVPWIEEATQIWSPPDAAGRKEKEERRRQLEEPPGKDSGLLVSDENRSVLCRGR